MCIEVLVNGAAMQLIARCSPGPGWRLRDAPSRLWAPSVVSSINSTHSRLTIDSIDSKLLNQLQ